MKIPLILCLLVCAVSANASKPCKASQLKPSFDVGVGMGHALVDVFLKNISKQACTIKGYPQIVFFGKKGRITREVTLAHTWPMGTELPPVVNNEKPVPPPPTTVLLSSGAEAQFEEYYADPGGTEEPEKNCTVVEYSELQLSPYKSRLKLPGNFTFCYVMSITSIRKAWIPVGERRPK